MGSEREMSNAPIERARALAQAPRKQVESRPQLPFQSMGESPTPPFQWPTSEPSHSGVKVSFGAPGDPRARMFGMRDVLLLHGPLWMGCL